MRALRRLGFVLLLVAVGICGSGRSPAVGSPLRSVSAVAPAPATRPDYRSGPQMVGSAEDSQPLRLLFVGASVTEGWFASSPSRTYPSIVARDLSTRGRKVDVRVVAQPGALAEQAEDWNLATPSDVVIVQMATNDFVKSVPVVDFASAYTQLLDRVRLASPRADLICLGGWDDPAARNQVGATARDYDVAARSACEAEAGRYVDLSAVYLNPGFHGPPGRPTFHGAGDEFHPNDRGHQELAALVVGAVDPRT